MLTLFGDELIEGIEKKIDGQSHVERQRLRLAGSDVVNSSAELASVDGSRGRLFKLVEI